MYQLKRQGCETFQANLNNLLLSNGGYFSNRRMAMVACHIELHGWDAGIYHACWIPSGICCVHACMQHSFHIHFSCFYHKLLVSKGRDQKLNSPFDDVSDMLLVWVELLQSVNYSENRLRNVIEGRDLDNLCSHLTSLHLDCSNRMIKKSVYFVLTSSSPFNATHDGCCDSSGGHIQTYLNGSCCQKFLIFSTSNYR